MNKTEIIRHQIQEIEISLDAISIKTSQHVSETDVPVQIERDKLELTRKLGRLKAELTTLELLPVQGAGGGASDAGGSPRVSRPEEILKNIHVDRDWEMDTFKQVIEGKSALHVLLVKAASGMGKTSLMNKFWEMAGGQKKVRVDFKNSSYSISDVLSEMTQMEEDSFPTLRYHYQELCLKARVPQNMPILALGSFVEGALSKMTKEDQEISRSMLVDALIADLAEIKRIQSCRIVILVDTFEKASDEVKQWMAKRFIDRVRKYPWLICVVAGREIPAIDADDGEWCLQHELQCLPDSCVREYIQKVKLTMSEDLISFITFASKGQPHDLQQFIMTYLASK